MSTKKPQKTPEYSAGQYRHLRRVFQHGEITPDSCQSRIMYEAGQRSVLAYIKSKVQVWT